MSYIMELCLDHAILTIDYHKANQYINQQLTHLNQYQPIMITARPKQKLLVYSNGFHGEFFFFCFGCFQRSSKQRRVCREGWHLSRWAPIFMFRGMMKLSENTDMQETSGFFYFYSCWLFWKCVWRFLLRIGVTG